MAGLEDMVYIVEREVVLVDGTRAQRLGLVEAVKIAAAEDLFVGHELIAAHLGIGIVARVLIDEFDDKVAVRAGCRSVDVREDFSGKNEVLLEDRQLPDGQVFAISDKALVLSHPVVPLRAVAVGWLDWTMAIGNRVSGVADVAGLCGGG